MKKFLHLLSSIGLTSLSVEGAALLPLRRARSAPAVLKKFSNPKKVIKHVQLPQQQNPYDFQQLQRLNAFQPGQHVISLFSAPISKSTWFGGNWGRVFTAIPVRGESSRLAVRFQEPSDGSEKVKFNNFFAALIEAQEKFAKKQQLVPVWLKCANAVVPCWVFSIQPNGLRGVNDWDVAFVSKPPKF